MGLSLGGSVPNGGEESRRFPRLLARCQVRIRDRFGVWDAETEDVGPRGCRIVTARPQTVGTLVSLRLESERVPEPLQVTGQIVWARADRPVRAGVSFAGGTSHPDEITPAAWFDGVLAAEEQARCADANGIVIEIEGPVPDSDELVDRLLHRARELLGDGNRAAAEMIFRRALALSPGDAALAAALRELAAPR
jgi:hypothetical protein